MAIASLVTSGVVKRFVVGLTVVRGQVELKGRLEQQRSWHTDNRNGAVGKIWESGFFLAGQRGSADTREIFKHSINVLKIGPTTSTDVVLGSTSLYDAINQNDSVACILSADRSKLYYVNNFSSGMNIGFLPDWSGLRTTRLISLLIGGAFTWHILADLPAAPHWFSLIMAVGGIAFFVISAAALHRSKQIWQLAMQQVSVR